MSNSIKATIQSIKSQNNKRDNLQTVISTKNAKPGQQIFWELTGTNITNKSLDKSSQPLSGKSTINKNGQIIINHIFKSKNDNLSDKLTIKLFDGSPKKQDLLDKFVVKPEIDQNSLPDKIIKEQTQTPSSRSSDVESGWNTVPSLILHSIDYFGRPNNIIPAKGKKEKFRWILAGPEGGKLPKKSLVRKLRMKPIATEDILNQEGFVGYSVIRKYNKKKFERLKKITSKNDFKIWLEPTEAKRSVFTLRGSIDTSTITESTFDTGNTPSHWNLRESGTVNANDIGMNAISAWDRVSGESIRIGISDDRQDLLHPDFSTSMEGDDNNGNGIPDQYQSVHGTLNNDRHGTAVAGLAIARINGTDAIGVAPEATYVPMRGGFRRIQDGGDLTAQDIYSNTDVVNHSWGQFDQSASLEREGDGTIRVLDPTKQAAWLRAIDESIIVQAVPNQRRTNNPAPGIVVGGWDDYNNDPMVHRKVIGVGATRRNGNIESYSSFGANVFVTAPARSVTSDIRGNNGYANGSIATGLTGTSFCAPQVAGTIALMLEANNNLTTRDIQHIFVETAQKSRLTDSNNDGELDSSTGGNVELRDQSFLPSVTTSSAGTNEGHNTGWFKNGAGHWVSDSFGFGVIDAGAAVDAAETWRRLKPELKVSTETELINPYTIQEGQLGDLESLNLAADWTLNSNLTAEWVEVTLNLNLTEQDETMVVLRSPDGTRSVLIAPGGNNNIGFTGTRTFYTNQFWDENIEGNWSLEAIDIVSDGDQLNTITDAKIDFYGTCQSESQLNIKSPRQESDLEEMTKQFIKQGGGSDNFELFSIKMLGNLNAAGVLSNGLDSNLLMDQGIIFTSGLAKNAIGPNDSESTTTDWNQDGHPLLNDNSFDAVGMDIRIRPNEDMDLQWGVQFGSEEFSEYSPSIFNDSAGLFIADVSKNPDLPLEKSDAKNYLIGPNGGPFSINEISEDPGYFEKYVDKNPACSTTMWEYDGGNAQLISTDKVSLRAGRTYVIAPLIADVSDGLWDSGVIFGNQ